MKNLLFSALVVMTSLVSFSSCQRKGDDAKPASLAVDQLSGSTKLGPVSFTKGSAADLTAALQVLKSSQGSKEIPASLYDAFDLTQLIVAKATGVSHKSYLFLGNNNTNQKQQALAIYGFGQKDAHAVVVETTPGTVQYSDYLNNFQITLSYKSGVVESSTSTLIAQTASPSKKSSPMAADCGDDTNACIQSVYTNHGWISTWGFVQTAFIPATALAVAADCALHNCILHF